MESALLIPVPEAEPAVFRWRQDLDSAAADGIPAHITVLYPFVDPSEADDEVERQLDTVVSQFEAFDYSFNNVRWFDDDVVYLEPQPFFRFTEMTAAIFEAFPQCPPYGGAFPEVIPHLTIGDNAARDELLHAAEDVAPKLPIHGRVTDLWWMQGDLGSWWTLRRAWRLNA